MAGVHTVKRELSDGTTKEYHYERIRYKGKKRRKSTFNMGGKVPPKTIGIYFLIKDGSVIYVGQSGNILIRLGQHSAAGIDFDDYGFLVCNAEDLDHLERWYIRQLEPPLNNDRYSRLRRSGAIPKLVKDGERFDRNEYINNINVLAGMR